jgi:hypothetical protein
LLSFFWVKLGCVHKIGGQLTPSLGGKMIKCKWCGKYVSYKDIDDGLAQFIFVPDTPFSSEEVAYACPSCHLTPSPAETATASAITADEEQILSELSAAMGITRRSAD